MLQSNQANLWPDFDGCAVALKTVILTQIPMVALPEGYKPASGKLKSVYPSYRIYQYKSF